MKDKELDDIIEEFKVQSLKTQKEREKALKLQQEKEELERAKRVIRDFNDDKFRFPELSTFMYKKYNRAVEIVKTDILKNMRTAAAEDYTEWLRGYFGNGGIPSGYYDYPFPADWFVATRDFDLVPLHGAHAMNIIVPGGVKFLGDIKNVGYNGLYFMKDYSHTGDCCVPIFSDVRFQKRIVKIETIKEIFRRWLYGS